jgi:DNA-binding NarL/FixJ family response regulator
MPDILTPSERAAIADAIAAGKINRIPAGVSATAVDYVWDGRSLVQVDGKSMHWRHRRKNPIGRQARKPEASERRDRVCAMSLQGIRQEDIAAELGISSRQVKAHVAILREAGRLPPCDRAALARETARARREKTEERRQQVRVLWQAGETWQAIADTLGINFTCVKRDILMLRRAGHKRDAA